MKTSFAVLALAGLAFAAAGCAKPEEPAAPVTPPAETTPPADGAATPPADGAATTPPAAN